MKKIASIVLALVLVLAMAAPAMAAETTGSITINSAENVTVEGKTFNAYKILDLELVGTAYVYTVPEGMEEFYAEEFELDQDAGDFDYEVTVKIQEMAANSDELFAFVAKALAAAKEAGVTPVSKTGEADADSVKIENLPLGYYVIEDTGVEKPVSALMLDSTDPDIEVTIKADKPKLEKKIDGDKDTDDTTAGDVDTNNAAIGEVVPYKLTSKVPDMIGYTKYFFVVTDTLSKGLTFNNDVVITIGDNTITACDCTEKDEDGETVHKNCYVMTTSTNDAGETVIEIVFKNFIQYNKNDEITITYSATVNENAVHGEIGNPNKVYLIYSNNPNEKADGTTENPDKPEKDDPTGKTPEDVTITYVTGIKVSKVDPEGNSLTGAQFEIKGNKEEKVYVISEVYKEDANGTYWKLTDGSYTTDDPNTEGMNKDMYASTTTKYSITTEKVVQTISSEVSAKAWVDESGILYFDGLGEGTYTITELVAPNGYNLLDKSIIVEITFADPTESIDTGAEKGDWTYKVTYDGKDMVSAEEDGRVVIKVENTAGTILPSTGGIGTTIFYIGGGLLIAAAVVLLVSKRKAEAK